MKKSTRRLLNLTLLILALGVTLGMSSFHSSRERQFYYWDLSGYHSTAVDLSEAFRRSPLDAMRQVKQSFSGEFSSLFAVPLVPVFLIFGDSRLTYIMAISVLYLLPLCLIVASLLASLFPARAFLVFWGTTFLMLFSPFTWTATLAGFPDIGGAAIVMLAVKLFLEDPTLAQFWRIPLIGALLGTAILFRRHYGYAAPPFFLAASVLTLMPLWKNRDSDSLKSSFKTFLRLGLAGVFLLITMYVLGRGFLTRYLSQNIGVLYSSYRWPKMSMVLWHYFDYFGAPTWIFAGLGLGLGLVSKREKMRDFSLFLSSYLLIWFLIWVPFTHIASDFYACLLIGIVMFGIGVFTFYLSQIPSRWLKGSALGLMGLFFSLHAAFGLSAWHSHQGGSARLWSTGYYASPHPSYDEILRLVRYLRGTVPQGQPIYVAASSGLLNEMLLIDAERQAYGRKQTQLNILGMPHADSNSFYPISPMLQAEYVIVALPFQHHLPEQEQKVVKVVVDAFQENWEFSQDFKALPEIFFLAGEVKVKVYRRDKPTSLPIVLKTLERVKNGVGRRPASQIDWFPLSHL